MRITPIFAALAMLFAVSTAQAGVEPPSHRFIFSGDDCTVDCIEGATATLSLFDYELGTTFDQFDIADFDFQSDSGVFDDFQLQFVEFANGLLTGAPGEEANVTIAGTALVSSLPVDVVLTAAVGEEELFFIDFLFQSTVGEGWSMEAFFIGEDFLVQQDDIGGIGTWSPAPEPGTLALFGAGLLGLGLMRRRQKLAA